MTITDLCWRALGCGRKLLTWLPQSLPAPPLLTALHPPPRPHPSVLREPGRGRNPLYLLQPPRRMRMGQHFPTLRTPHCCPKTRERKSLFSLRIQRTVVPSHPRTSRIFPWPPLAIHGTAPFLPPCRRLPSLGRSRRVPCCSMQMMILWWLVPLSLCQGPHHHTICHSLKEAKHLKLRRTWHISSSQKVRWQTMERHGCQASMPDTPPWCHRCLAGQKQLSLVHLPWWCGPSIAATCQRVPGSPSASSSALLPSLLTAHTSLNPHSLVPQTQCTSPVLPATSRHWGTCRNLIWRKWKKTCSSCPSLPREGK